MKKRAFLIITLVLALLLSACGKVESPKVQKTTKEVTMVVTQDSIKDLDNYPNLEKADLSGSTCYDAIVKYMAAHPDVEVIYTVDLGHNTAIRNTETSLTLQEGSYNYNALKDYLRYLPKVVTVNLPGTELSADQISELKAAYVNVEITFTVTLGGTELDTQISALNLSNIEPNQVDSYAKKLGLLPNLTNVELMDSQGSCKLSPGDVKKLQAAAPNAAFNYSFELFGQTVSINAEKLEISNAKIGDEGVARLRAALDLLHKCTSLKLDKCEISADALAQLRADYSKIEIVSDDGSGTTPDPKPDPDSKPDPDPKPEPDPGTGGPTSTPKRKVTTTVTASNILSTLEQYKYLEEADLTGSTCYDAILSYMKAHPTVDVYFTVPMGGSTVKNTTEDLSLKQGSYDFDTLIGNLKYVTSLKHLSLPGTTLTSQQLRTLRSTYPSVDISFTLTVQGTELNETVTSADMSAITAEQVDSAIEQLRQYPNVIYVELMKDGSSSLSIADVKKLQDALPNVVFHYSFELFGKTVSTTDQRIEYVKKSIGDSGEAKIRQALEILDGCTYFLLDDCDISNEILADIRSDFPNTKVVWRIHQYNKGRSWLTDTKVLRAVYGINDNNSYVLRYLNEVKYMDLGHNTEMSDISFCAFMPDLEIAILSGAPIKDVSPLANCKKLEFLELAWCGTHLSDISPLAGCTGLRYLNVGQTNVKDLTPLKDLKLLMLSHVTSGKKGITAADWQVFQTQHPDCWITSYHKDGYPYSTGWRFKTSGGYTDIYRKARDVFGYDEIDKVLQGQN